MSADPDAPLPQSLRHILRFADLPQRKPTRFALEPDADACAALAAHLDLSGLRKLRFAGALTPLAGRDWRLTAELGATLVQPCAITLAPVTTRIDVDVTRTYCEDAALPEAAAGSEIEMPEDDTRDALPDTLDLGQVMIEALALEIPMFPRAPGADLGELQATPEGAAPLDGAAMKPFAGLAALRDKLENKD